MNMTSWLEGWRNTRFVEKRFVVVGIPSLDIEELEELSLIKQLESPVVVAIGPSVRRPISSFADSLVVLEEDTESTTLLERPMMGGIVLMNARPRIEEVAEGMNLSLSLPDDQERLQAVMSHVPVRSLEGWRGRVVYRMDASCWEMELHVPLGIEEGDRIFSTLVDNHDSPDRPASPASYHDEVLDFDNNTLDS